MEKHINRRSKTKALLIGLVSSTIFVGCGGNSHISTLSKQYYESRCKTAGEFIYETANDVQGLYQMRLRDPRDILDRLKDGDIPEDPWGHRDHTAQRPWGSFLYGYHFFETTLGSPIVLDWSKSNRQWMHEHWLEHYIAEPPNVGEGKYWRYSLGKADGGDWYYSRYSDRKRRPLVIERSDELKSRYGFTWREIRTPTDIKHDVWGGELIIQELRTQKILAIKRGFILRGYGSCPKKKDSADYYNHPMNFIEKVLRPAPFAE